MMHAGFGRKKWLVYGLVVLAVLGGGAVGVRWLSAVRAPVVTVHAAPLLSRVVATATVQTPHRASLGVQLAGAVESVSVIEGDRVRAGQILVQLDAREWRAALESAQLALQQAELKWQQWQQVQAPVARQGLQQAQATLAQAQAQFERQQRLWQQGFVGQAALDEARRALDVAQAQTGSAAAQARAHADGGLEQTLAANARQQARANVQAAQARLSYATLRAPFDALVVSRNVEPGDTVQPGKVLLTLAPQGVTELVAQIDERHLDLLRLGQPAQASVDAFADQLFSARVVRIAPAVDAQRGSVQVRLQVVSAPDFLRQDMTASLEIEVARKARALSVPVLALHEAQGSPAWVWTLDDAGLARRTTVEPGLRGAADIEVLSGLSEGARVVVLPANGLREGQRVRPSDAGA